MHTNQDSRSKSGAFSNLDPDFGALGPAQLPRAIDTSRHIAGWAELDYDGKFRDHFHPFILNLSGIKGAIFDLDGFLVNSEKPIVRCIMLGARDLVRESLGNADAPLPDPIVTLIKEKALGNADTKMSTVVRRILDDAGLLPARAQALSENDFIDEFRVIRRDHFRALINHGEFKELAGAINFIQKVSALLDGRVSIFTGSPKENADLEIAALGLDDYLPRELRRYASDLPPGKGKPDPTGFLMAKAALGLNDSDRWISGGDRWKDAIGAFAAGGCALFLAVPENLDDIPFQRAFLDLKRGSESFFDGTILSPEARTQINQDLEEVHRRLVFVQALHETCLDVRIE